VRVPCGRDLVWRVMPWLRVAAIVGLVIFVLGVVAIALDEQCRWWPEAIAAVGVVLIFAVAIATVFGWAE